MDDNVSMEDAIAHIHNRHKVTGPELQETQTFKARCHCGNIQFSVTLATSILPLNAGICACTMCRYSHGTFGAYHATLPPGVTPEWTNNSINLSVYKTPGGGAGGHGQRLFCSLCGAHNGHFEPWISQWIIDISLFDGPVFWKYVAFGFPKSNGDGGILSWLPSVGGKEMIQVSPDHDSAPEYEVQVGKNGEERLRAECLCGGVSFTIPRPSDEVRKDEYLSKYISPSDPRKWKALLDFCRDCRLVSSVNGMPWVLVPRAVLEPEVPSDLRIGTMKTYESSDKGIRAFCGKCGATVFGKAKARSPSERQEVINVAVGILRAPEGAKAENWVTWRAGKPTWAEDAMKYDPEFVGAVVEGQKKWSLEKYGEAPDFDCL
ncbi:DUF636 domain protein [Hypoxylon sp. FL0890]|nr:DUF636 domain protein [Hypoxylon sp. FL0890]